MAAALFDQGPIPKIFDRVFLVGAYFDESGAQFIFAQMGQFLDPSRDDAHFDALAVRKIEGAIQFAVDRNEFIDPNTNASPGDVFY